MFGSNHRLSFTVYGSGTDRRTDGASDGQTDRQTPTPLRRVALPYRGGPPNNQQIMYLILTNYDSVQISFVQRLLALTPEEVKL